MMRRSNLSAGFRPKKNDPGDGRWVKPSAWFSLGSDCLGWLHYSFAADQETGCKEPFGIAKTKLPDQSGRSSIRHQTTSGILSTLAGYQETRRLARLEFVFGRKQPDRGRRSSIRQSNEF